MRWWRQGDAMHICRRQRELHTLAGTARIMECSHAASILTNMAVAPITLMRNRQRVDDATGFFISLVCGPGKTKNEVRRAS